MSGLRINGRNVDVPGVSMVGPGDLPWAHLDARDYRKRPTQWVRQIVQHTTKGEWPQTIRAGKGPANRDERVARFWQGSERQSAAHIVTDSDGSAACLADVYTVEAYHATVVNRWSIGIETYQEAAGVIFQAAIDSTVRITRTLCLALGIQYQVPQSPYRGAPLKRIERNGGPDVVGIIGHRDVTDNRGRGDPGDAIMAALVADGAEEYNLDRGDDLAVWKERQAWLNSRGHKLTVDGIAGPATVAALKLEGFPGGVWAFGGRER